MKEWTYSKVPVFIVASLMLAAIFLGIVGCGEDEGEDEIEENNEITDTSPKVIEIIPEPGTEMEPREIKPETNTEITYPVQSAYYTDIWHCHTWLADFNSARIRTRAYRHTSVGLMLRR